VFLERAWKRAAPRGGSREVIFAEEYETIEAFLAVGFRVGRPPDWVFWVRNGWALITLTAV
jgi:hypothetical protein